MQHFFRQILENLANMHESSVPQCFTSNTGKQSGPKTFNELKSVMNLLTNLRVMGVLCIFRLVLEGKAGTEILDSTRSEFLEKI